MVNFTFKPQLRTMRCGGENAEARKSQLGSVDEVTSEAYGGPSSLKLPTLPCHSRRGEALYCTSRPDKRIHDNSLDTHILDGFERVFNKYTMKISGYPICL